MIKLSLQCRFSVAKMGQNFTLHKYDFFHFLFFIFLVEARGTIEGGLDGVCHDDTVLRLMENC